MNLIYELEPADEMPETYLRQHFILIALDDFRATYLLDGRWKHTGLTPHQYVMKCRIEKAKQLLRHQELALVEICQEVGFTSQSHFTRVFRQYTKTTPKAYRKAL